MTTPVATGAISSRIDDPTPAEAYKANKDSPLNSSVQKAAAKGLTPPTVPAPSPSAYEKEKKNVLNGLADGLSYTLQNDPLSFISALNTAGKSNFDAAVKAMVLTGNFEILTSFWHQQVKSKVAPQVISNFEDLTFSLLSKYAPDEMNLKALEVLLNYFSERVSVFITSYTVDCKSAGVDGEETVVFPQLERAITLREKVRVNLTKSIKALESLKAALKDRPSIELTDNVRRAVSSIFEFENDTFETMYHTYQHQSSSLEEKVAALQAGVDSCVAALKAYDYQILRYLECYTKTKYLHVQFKDKTRTERFASNELQRLREDFNKIKYVNKLTETVYASNIPVSDVPELFKNLSTEFSLLNDAMRNERKARHGTTEEDLAALKKKIDFFVRMRNFLVDQAESHTSKVVDSEKRYNELQATPPVPEAILKQVALRSKVNLEELKTSSKQTEQEQVDLQGFLKAVQQELASLREQVARNDKEIAAIIDAYNNDGKDPRNSTTAAKASDLFGFKFGIKPPKEEVKFVDPKALPI